MSPIAVASRLNGECADSYRTILADKTIQDDERADTDLSANVQDIKVKSDLFPAQQLLLT